MAIVSKLLGLTKRRKSYMSMEANDSISMKSENYSSPIYIQDASLCSSVKDSNRLQSISEDDISAVVVSDCFTDMCTNNVLTNSNMAIPCRKGYYVQYKTRDHVVAGKYKVEERNAADLILSANKNGIVAYNLENMEILYQYPWASIENIRHEDNTLKRTDSRSKSSKDFLGVHRKDGGVFVIESDHISEFKEAIFKHHTDPGTLKWIDTKLAIKANAHRYMYI
ncbi:hypothetical protein SARC_08572 [Sphaeroforma arctica JP610]|uniref:Uncharacterized protein n=1 Tax=Sphaeroforma arctica JP610 TaxID=667725 RepID=A0A0L0FQF8_9EUKA|nr:hypothetical protein SARC_08572 [Sphaeroforma arctica JP610]KNC79012.1 hypothetical protein SARC_08572 [Sphaeroforma arctica JP610]|eukprot:XP_014152914.1 hypothetical protein SARC_08572 [Sphaeroforma arctica JP610]